MELQQQNGRNLSRGPNAVELNNVTSSWSASQEHATLDSVSLCFKTNQICAVIGPVGCGKVIHFYILFDKEKYKKMDISCCSHHYFTQFWEKYQTPPASLRQMD